MKLNYFLIRNLAFVMLFAGMLSCKSQTTHPVTPEEARAFAQKLENSIKNREAGFMNDAIDKKLFLKKAGLGSNQNARAFKAGIEDGMKMGNTITRTISRKATYELVKQYAKKDTQHILFRMYDDGSLNYHDIQLVKIGTEVKIADIFVYTTGEHLTETIRGLYNQMESAMDNKALKNSQNSWASKLPEMRQLMNEGKYKEAIAVYEDLPRDIQKMRAVQIVHVLIASGLDDFDAYNAAIEEYKTLYPNEPNMHLLLLDGYIINKQYDKALEGVNELDKMINKDPLLDYYRYLCYNLKKDDANAKIALERLMKNMPEFQDGMLELIAMYIEVKNKAAANEWIRKFKSYRSYDQEKLQQLLTAYQYEPS